MLKSNLIKIRNEINISSNDPIKVPKLIAVSKTFPKEDIKKAYDAGQYVFGENKVQEFLDKYYFFRDLGIDNIEWHIIGHLQSNKVKWVAAYADYYHCLDSIRIAKKLDKYCQEYNRKLCCLVQVNISGENSKFGISPDSVEDFMRSLSILKNIKIVGLMSIGSYYDIPEEANDEFQKMLNLLNYLKSLNLSGIELSELSMGMSHDFMVAIKHGATMVRVGSAIFGNRVYDK